jgi:5-methylcytosine-specific restriction endonuclease McrA
MFCGSTALIPSPPSTKGNTSHEFMSDILDKNIVLVLNRNWQAINARTPADAFCQMATTVATALDIDAESIRPIA